MNRFLFLQIYTSFSLPRRLISHPSPLLCSSINISAAYLSDKSCAIAPKANTQRFSEFFLKAESWSDSGAADRV